MKNHKLGIFLWIFGAVILCVGVVGIIVNFGLASDGGENNIGLIAASVVLIVLSFIPLCIGYRFSFKADKDMKKRIALYSSYPVRQIVDYKKELDAVRANYSADNNSAKNKIEVFPFTNSKQCYNFSVLQNGKIYYAYLVRAFPAFYSVENLARTTLPAVVVYSTDEFFEKNPMGLKEIAVRFYVGRNTNILKNDANFFTNVKLPDTTTGGREVYATTVMAYRLHLPLYCFSDTLFPIIANPEKSSSAFIVDFKYWTEAQIGNFAHAVAEKSKIV